MVAVAQLSLEVVGLLAEEQRGFEQVVDMKQQMHSWEHRIEVLDKAADMQARHSAELVQRWVRQSGVHSCSVEVGLRKDWLGDWAAARCKVVA